MNLNSILSTDQITKKKKKHMPTFRFLKEVKKIYLLKMFRKVWTDETGFHILSYTDNVCDSLFFEGFILKNKDIS